MPLAGTLLAIIFYEFVFVRTLTFLQDGTEEPDEQNQDQEAIKSPKQKRNYSSVSDTLDMDNWKSIQSANQSKFVKTISIQYSALNK